MRNGFLDTSLIIETKVFYKTQELFELIKEKLGDKFGPISTNKELKLVETIFIEGADGWVDITSSEWGFGGKGRIRIGIDGPIKKSFKDLKNLKARDIILPIVLNIITLGLYFLISRIVEFFRRLFHLEGTKKNRAFMRAVASEIEMLVKK